MVKCRLRLLPLLAALAVTGYASADTLISKGCAEGDAAICLNDADAALKSGESPKVIASLERACELDEPDGCFVLANLYKRAVLDGADYAKASTWFGRWRSLLESACDKDDSVHVTRCARVAGYYRDGKSDIWNGVVVALVKKDAGKAQELYTKLGGSREALCSRGDAEACFDLALQCEEGLGVEANASRAKDLFATACRGHQGQACFRAGLYDEACKYGETDACDKMCEQGSDSACEAASPNVKQAHQRQLAKAHLPELITECGKHRNDIERTRTAKLQPQGKAYTKFMEQQRTWRLLQANIRAAIDVAVEPMSPDWENLMKEVRNKCTCEEDLQRPGACKKYKGDEPLQGFMRNPQP